MNNYCDVEAIYRVTIQYDSNGKLFDINIYDGIHSISVDKFEDISDIIKELEERCE